ncbi:MAG: hypothetical protein PHJ00_06610 [Candidatus Omnitrophica bacterium]|jgi:Flp pilus assembly pilin Flp|nr:hypothetical protein [Candidatus Omnitrophota bacterium]
MKNTGQSLIEYAILLSLIVAALFGMQVYLKRGISGKMRSSADELSGGFFYSPGATQAATTIDTTTAITSKSYVTDVAGSTDYKVSIMESTLKSDRTANREEKTLPFSAEPMR